MDNLANKGIEDDRPRPGKKKPRGKKAKPFGIEYRVRRDISSSLLRLFPGWGKWRSHCWYTTRNRRDTAMLALNKNQPGPEPLFEYRPVDRA